jgi:CheY-like chemotaxis protein
LSIETAISGFEAIDKIKSGKIYDIVFMDHMMLKMDGIEAVRIIRSMGYAHPIIALTANAVIGQAEIFLNNGFDAFISKPINVEQLNTELNKFIRDKQIQKQEIQKTQMPKASSALLSIFVRDVRNALPILESTLAGIETISDDDIQLYAITAHGIKSALANIGQTEFSQMAYSLEKAGKEKDKSVIKQQTKKLVDALKKIITEIEG